jgi:hypothetical protein
LRHAHAQELRYDANRGMRLLVEDWVSRASALQRRGRAGRVRPGVCYGLYTRDRFESRLRKFQVPPLVALHEPDGMPSVYFGCIPFWSRELNCTQLMVVIISFAMPRQT